MRDRNKSYIVPDLFTPDECDQIIELCSPKPMVEGTIWNQTAADKYESIVDVKVRKARNFPFDSDLPELQWVVDRLRTASRQVNSEWYEFNLTETQPDRIAFVHYPLGGFFGPHVDNLGSPKLMYKKLTCVVQLSDPDSYEGGELRISHENDPMPKHRGTMICFPTYVRHMVEPVTKGERFILVNWCNSETHFQ